MPRFDQIVVFVGVGLVLAYVPIVFMPSYTPRLALVAVLGAAGLVGVVGKARRGDLAAYCALTLSAWIVLSAIFSGHPWPTLIGVLGRESSALILVGSVLAWGAAREIGAAGRRLFESLLLWALIANAVVGLVQIVFNIESGSFQLYSGRATGLLVSHVAFGACMAGGAVLVAARTQSDRDFANLGMIGLFAAMANLSGSRFAVMAGLIATLAVCAVRRPLRRALLPTLSYVGGFAFSVLASTLALPGQSATDRAANAEGAGRLEAWGYGLRAMLERPLFGWGPGRFRAAVQGRFSADFTGAHAGDEVTQIWWDAHNIVVNTAVTLGIVGLGLALAFGFFVVARARGPLAWFAGVVAASWLLQPAGLATLPLVLFCLGAAALPLSPASPEPASSPESAGRRSDAGRAALLVGVALALLVLLADVQIKAAIESGTADEVAAAAARLPWDPVVAELASEAHLIDRSGPSSFGEAIVWAGKAIDREPDRPYYLNRLAVLQLAADQDDAARATLEAALELQPWNVQTWLLMGVVAERSEDDQLRARVAAAQCALAVTECVERS